MGVSLPGLICEIRYKVLWLHALKAISSSNEKVNREGNISWDRGAKAQSKACLKSLISEPKEHAGSPYALPYKGSGQSFILNQQS